MKISFRPGLAAEDDSAGQGYFQFEGICVGAENVILEYIFPHRPKRANS